MRALLRELARVAKADAPVLLEGETGAGKEVVARHLHRSGPRAAGPFVAVNCGALPDELTEGLLFGHEQGAFTGAERARAGIFERAHGGVLFLDEVGELRPRAQAALLRVLEARRVTRLGATRERGFDLRLVSATNRDLGAMVAQGRFREDLFYRLHVIAVRVPPLRERPDDIEALARGFLAEARAGGRPARLSQGALERLRRHPWPGNVRELCNVISAAAVLAHSEMLSEADIEPHLRLGGGPPVGHSGDRGQSLRQRLLRHEAELIADALARTRGCVQQAARQLQVPVRTLHRRMRSLGVSRRCVGT
jgi:DNA-binding NtrC family response regulator